MRIYLLFQCIDANKINYLSHADENENKYLIAESVRISKEVS